MNAATTSRFHSSISPASRQRSARRRSMSSSSRSIREGACHVSVEQGRTTSDAAATDVPTPCASATRHTAVSPGVDGSAPVRCLVRHGTLRFGPARVPSRESPEAAVELLLERGYSACEIDFEGKFWMDYPWAERFGEVAREAGIVLSVHAPIAGFMGHLDRGKKYNMATGMLDHSAGVAVAGRRGRRLPPGVPARAHARGRARLDRRPARLAPRAARGQGPRVPFGIEVMGRVREIGTSTTCSTSRAASAGCGR